jgi:DNA-binding NarL/FixJ family response regulator
MSPELVIADDHPLLLKGLKDFLEESGYTIAAMASDGQNAFKAIQEYKPLIAILDLEMPDMTGLQVAKACKEIGIKTKIILFTLHRELFIYQQAKELNISGYLLKEFATEELLTCLNKIQEGKEYFSSKIFQKKGGPKVLNEGIALTPSEKKILKLIADGLTTKDIADKLFIAERTVEKHRSNIINKLNLDKKHNTLLIWAQRNKGIIF